MPRATGVQVVTSLFGPVGVSRLCGAPQGRAAVDEHRLTVTGSHYLDPQTHRVVERLPIGGSISGERTQNQAAPRPALRDGDVINEHENSLLCKLC